MISREDTYRILLMQCQGGVAKDSKFVELFDRIRLEHRVYAGKVQLLNWTIHVFCDFYKNILGWGILGESWLIPH